MWINKDVNQRIWKAIMMHSCQTVKCESTKCESVNSCNDVLMKMWINKMWIRECRRLQWGTHVKPRNVNQRNVNQWIAVTLQWFDERWILIKRESSEKPGGRNDTLIRCEIWINEMWIREYRVAAMIGYTDKTTKCESRWMKCESSSVNSCNDAAATTS